MVEKGRFSVRDFMATHLGVDPDGELRPGEAFAGWKENTARR